MVEKCLYCGCDVDIPDSLFCSKFHYREYKRNIINMLSEIQDAHLAMVKEYVFILWRTDNQEKISNPDSG